MPGPEDITIIYEKFFCFHRIYVKIFNRIFVENRHSYVL